jgi:hypothetical protein
LSLAALAPTEKSENLIYVTFPLAISLLIATLVSSNPTEWITIIGVISPPLTIILYEFGYDETYIKNKYTQKMLEKRPLLADTFASYHLYLKTWESEIADVAWGEKFARHPNVEAQHHIEQALSSYPVRRRFWRLRGTFYLQLSILCFVPAGLIVFQRIFNIVLDLLVGTIYLTIAIVITGGLIAAINYAGQSRREEIHDHLFALVKFLYLQTTVIVDKTIDANNYQANPRKQSLVLELDSLDKILTRGDWTIWFARWNEMSDNINRVVRRDMKSLLRTVIFKSWGQTVNSYLMGRRHFERDLRTFDWYIFYIDIWKHNLIDDSLVKFAGEWVNPRINWEHKYHQWLSQSPSPDSIMDLTNTIFDPNSIFIRAKLISKFDTRSELTPIAQALGSGISGVLKYNPDDNYDTAIRIMMEELLDPSIPKLDLPFVAGLIVDYIRERNKLHLPPIFPKGYGIERLLAIIKWVDESERVLLVADFLENSNEQDFKKLLEEEQLKTYLFGEREWETVNSKVKEFLPASKKQSPLSRILRELKIERKKFLRKDDSDT